MWRDSVQRTHDTKLFQVHTVTLRFAGTLLQAPEQHDGTWQLSHREPMTTLFVPLNWPYVLQILFTHNFSFYSFVYCVSSITVVSKTWIISGLTPFEASHAPWGRIYAPPPFSVQTLFSLRRQTAGSLNVTRLIQTFTENSFAWCVISNLFYHFTSVSVLLDTCKSNEETASLWHFSVIAAVIV